MATILSIKVTPNASQNKIEGWQEGILRIKIRSVPEKGKANAALIAYLADLFNIPKSAIKILSGATARIKRLEIEGLTKEEIDKLL